MTALILAFLTVSTHLRPRHPVTIVGEWSPWRITSGDALETPPKHGSGKLVFKSDGTFAEVLTEWLSNHWIYTERVSGTYHIHGNLISLKSVGTVHGLGQKPKRVKYSRDLIRRAGQLWEGSYLDGTGSFIYTRPGQKPQVPLDQNRWPSMEDFNP